MNEILEKTSTEILREYYYDARGCYPPKEFTREQIIKVILKNK